MKENKKFTNVLTRNISELAAFKLVMSWQKKFLKYCCRDCGTITLVSLWGDSFTDVGYNIGQVETILGCSYRYHCVFWTGLLSTPTATIYTVIRTCYSKTQRDYLIIKFIDDMKICLLNGTKSLLFHLFHKLHIISFFSSRKKRVYLPLCVNVWENEGIMLQTLRGKQKYHVTNVGVEKIKLLRF